METCSRDVLPTSRESPAHRNGAQQKGAKTKHSNQIPYTAISNSATQHMEHVFLAHCSTSIRWMPQILQLRKQPSPPAPPPCGWLTCNFQGILKTNQETIPFARFLLMADPQDPAKFGQLPRAAGSELLAFSILLATSSRACENGLLPASPPGAFSGRPREPKKQFVCKRSRGNFSILSRDYSFWKTTNNPGEMAGC